MLLKLLKLVVSIMAIVLVAHFLSLGVAALELDVQPRAVKPLNWISDTFVTGPLGPNATSIWLFATVGLTVLTLILRYFAGEFGIHEPRQRSQERAAEDPVEQQGTNLRRRTFGQKDQRTAPTSEPSLEEIIASMNLDRVITPQPAWQLLPLDEDVNSEQPTSWLGGRPYAPASLEWPKFSNGRPLMFLAQIDLATLKPCPETGERPAGLANDGMLLFFLGFDGAEHWEFAVRYLSLTELAGAVQHEMPAGVMTPRDLGLFSYEPAMKHTFVRLNCVMDDEDTPLVSKLMGIEPSDDFGYHFPEGYQNLLFIKHDDAIGTASENWQGMTIACPTAKLACGIFDHGKLFGIHNG